MIILQYISCFLLSFDNVFNPVPDDPDLKITQKWQQRDISLCSLMHISALTLHCHIHTYVCILDSETGDANISDVTNCRHMS